MHGKKTFSLCLTSKPPGAPLATFLLYQGAPSLTSKPLGAPLATFLLHQGAPSLTSKPPGAPLATFLLHQGAPSLTSKPPGAQSDECKGRVRGGTQRIYKNHLLLYFGECTRTHFTKKINHKIF